MCVSMFTSSCWINYTLILFRLTNYILQTLQTQYFNYIKLKKAKKTESGSGQISARTRPEPDPDLFFKLISGRNRIFFLIWYPAGSGSSRNRILDPVDHYLERRIVGHNILNVLCWSNKYKKKLVFFLI